jgi:hypothetical protein
MLETKQCKQSVEGLPLGTKITPLHIDFESEKMKVYLAAQLFSESTANALEYCLMNEDDFAGCEATIRFTRVVNSVFDIFNSKNQGDSGFKRPLDAINYDATIRYLDQVDLYFRQLKTETGKLGKIVPITKSNVKTGFLGTIVNISSLKSLYGR